MRAFLCPLQERIDAVFRVLGFGIREPSYGIGARTRGPSSGQASCPSGIKLLPDGSDCLLVEVVVPHRPNAYQVFPLQVPE